MVNTIADSRRPNLVTLRNRPNDTFSATINKEIKDAVRMEIDIRAWLEGLGLGEYFIAFEENRVDGQVLSSDG